MSKLESSRQGPPGLLRVVPMVLVPLSLLGCVALVYVTGGARRRQILEEVDRWNTQEGRPKGLYIRLGGEGDREEWSAHGLDGSPDDFWLAMYPRSKRGRAALWNSVVPMVYLYMNPVTREEWCRSAGVEFSLPRPQVAEEEEVGGDNKMLLLCRGLMK